MKCRVEFTSPMEFSAPMPGKIDTDILRGLITTYGKEMTQIARNLARVKKLLTPTQWAEWLKVEFGWTEEVAQFLMNEVVSPEPQA
jgi:hypothetical protein